MTDAAPDVIGEIVGCRAWRVQTSTLYQPTLISVTRGTVWRPGRWTTAECKYDNAGVPHDGHQCGIYAAADWEHLAELGYNRWGGVWDRVVVGEVALAGDVIVGEKGWRAEKARPVRLWVAHTDWQLVRPLMDAYDIPVTLANILRGEACGHRA